MASLANPFVALALLSALVGYAGATVTWRQRDAAGARAFATLLAVLGTWSLLYAGQLLAPTIGTKQPWLVARHALSPAVPITFWAFAVGYTDRERLRSARAFGPIVAVGLVLAVIPIVDPAGLYWRSIEPARLGTLTVADIGFGPLFWAVLAYIVVVVGAGHAMVVDMLVDSFAVYRRQLLAMAVAGALGFGLLALFLTEHVPGAPLLSPFPNVQLLSYGMVLFAIPLGWSYYREAFFSLQPLAHRTVIGNMDDAVFVLDPDDVIRSANGPARRLVGSPTEDELVGVPIDRAFADRPALERRYRAVEAGAASDEDGPSDGGSTGGEGDVETDPVALVVDGDSRHYDVRVSAIENGRGHPIGSVLALRDVTERARQRERIEQKNEQLERLADVVAHDMRGPLSTAEKVRTLLERDLDGAEVDVGDTMADLAAVHGRLQEFADHLPQLARESTDVRTPETCDLATVAAQAWTVVDTGTLSLAVESTRTLEADPRRLERALQNLFENAATHATTAATADVGRTDGTVLTGDGRAGTVSVGATDRGFYVADDGPGIPPDRREEIFEYGVSTGDGSGFGLAIVRTIVEAHGWGIEASESADGGARFEVRTDG